MSGKYLQSELQFVQKPNTCAKSRNQKSVASYSPPPPHFDAGLLKSVGQTKFLDALDDLNVVTMILRILIVS